MKIQILDLAKADPIEGHRFYEKQEAGSETTSCGTCSLTSTSFN